MIPDDKIAEVRERTDIVALVSEYVALRRVGASFRGLCPFHPEKSPSFYVNPARQFYHCFGCKASGDAISFVMRAEGREFPDAARLLADRAGLELPIQDAQSDAAHRRQRAFEERLTAIVEAAAGFYIKQLHEHPHAHLARAELERRRISSATAETFRLGYAPFGWDALAHFLRDQGWSTTDAETAGLLVSRRSGEGHYDRFRHRLMFPIADPHGRIVAFSGRQLDLPTDVAAPSGEPPAKYVNSPESPLFQKSNVLFGLFEGRVTVRREGVALLCEGNFDVLALHQAGYANAVAPLGTAFTEAHARLLRRYCERVYVLFDGDRAGRKAVLASQPLLQKAALNARVVTLPSGGDPDSYLREHGPEGLRDLLAAAPGMIEHLIDEAASESAGDPRLQAEAIGALAPVLRGVENAVERRLYLERIARKFGVSDLDVVRRQLRQGLRANEPTKRGASSPRVPRRDLPAPSGQEVSLPVLQCELVGVLLDNPKLFSTQDANNLEELLTRQDLRAIFQVASRMVEARGSVDGSALLGLLAGNPLYAWLEERLAIHKYDEPGAVQALRDGIPRLARQNIERELPKLQERILQARRAGDETQAAELTREHVALFRSAKELIQGTRRVMGREQGSP